MLPNLIRNVHDGRICLALGGATGTFPYHKGACRNPVLETPKRFISPYKQWVATVVFRLARLLLVLLRDAKNVAHAPEVCRRFTMSFNASDAPKRSVVTQDRQYLGDPSNPRCVRHPSSLLRQLPRQAQNVGVACLRNAPLINLWARSSCGCNAPGWAAALSGAPCCPKNIHLVNLFVRQQRRSTKLPGAVPQASSQLDVSGAPKSQSFISRPLPNSVGFLGPLWSASLGYYVLGTNTRQRHDKQCVRTIRSSSSRKKFPVFALERPPEAKINPLRPGGTGEEIDSRSRISMLKEKSPNELPRS